MAPTKKTEEFTVKKIGPIYPVFAEEKVKRGGKITKRLVVKEKRIWVQWKSSNKTEEWTAEPLAHFSGDSKKKAEASLAKGECWPWKEPDRVQALKSLEKRNYSLSNHIKPEPTKEIVEEEEGSDVEEDDEV